MSSRREVRKEKKKQNKQKTNYDQNTNKMKQLRSGEAVRMSTD